MLLPDRKDTSIVDAVVDAGQITDNKRLDPRMVCDLIAAIVLPKNTETSSELENPDTDTMMTQPPETAPVEGEIVSILPTIPTLAIPT